ncbi:MAG: hypothetical protein HKN33_01440 [Pyrinomonadaceae bacterium]|nr:hypothetical protein [Pyrinomonadaceae bacterium]
MPKEFRDALSKNCESFEIELSQQTLASLDEFYETLCEFNPVLHLVGKCSVEEFAVRHILESIYVLNLFKRTSLLTDVGTGAGLPSIPCLLADQRLRGVLIESKLKKSDYLETQVRRLGLEERAKIINKQFSEAPRPKQGLVVTRALDRMSKNVAKLVSWSGRCDLALFAGEAVREELKRIGIRFTEHLIPLSERRYVFVIEKGN